ncbi:hypothetical protein FRC03_011120 [Tulasnella sp. 419]|nr:hypothetical protein FRC03_011120 [Tulasnella sp. 419]
MSSTASISSDAASKALALLLEDFKLGQQNRIGDTHTMKEPESTRQGLERNIEELELALSGFTHHVRHVIAGVRRQQNTLALIHRLPIEILQYIFALRASEAFCCGMSELAAHWENSRYHFRNPEYRDNDEICDDFDGPDYRSFSYAIAPRLSKVCSHWYNLVVAHPRIWSYLDTRLSQKTTALYLERSKGTPLFITCSSGVGISRESKFMKLVIPHLDRWKAFNSYSKHRSLLMDLPKRDVSFPSLELFRIHTSDGAVAELPYDLFERTPNLREYHVDWLSFPFQMGSEILSGLTSLGIRGMFDDDEGFTLQDYELLFTSCPRLRTLSITGANDCPADLSTFSVKIPNLKSLYLYNFDSRLLTTLLFSLFPDPAKPPIVKIIGFCDPDVSKQAFMDPTRVGSFMELACRNMVGLSTIDEGRESIHSGLVQVWGELEGKRSTFLEVAQMVRCLDKIAAPLLPPNGISALRELSLTTAHHVARTLAPNLHRCPHLERLIITNIEWDPEWQRQTINLITDLAFPAEPAASGPQLKYLFLKGVGYNAVTGLTDLLNARHKSKDILLMDSVLLHRLEKLAVQSRYITHPLEDDTSRVERLLAPRGIAFEFVDI